jgi:hypothetical protein
MAVTGSSSPSTNSAQDCRQYYHLGADYQEYEEDFECDEAVDVPIERLKLALINDDDNEARERMGKGGSDQQAVSLAEELFEATTKDVIPSKKSNGSAATFKEIFVNRLDSGGGNRVRTAQPMPSVDVVIRSEPLPYDGLNGYATSSSPAAVNSSNGSVNQNIILIKKVGMVSELGLGACGQCGNGCCVS